METGHVVRRLAHLCDSMEQMIWAMWFGLALIALAGAVALLYIDRVQRRKFGHARQVWARSHNFEYEAADPALPATWQRAALAKQDYLHAMHVVRGVRRGEPFVLFDLEAATTVVAVQRAIGSDVDIDLRTPSIPAPREADMAMVGAVGPRVVFSNDVDVARRVCDMRMAAFVENLSEKVQYLWTEADWTIATLPVDSGPRDWERGLDAVLRLSGIAYALPPTSPTEFTSAAPDPGGPRLPPLGWDQPAGAVSNIPSFPSAEPIDAEAPIEAEGVDQSTQGTYDEPDFLKEEFVPEEYQPRGFSPVEFDLGEPGPAEPRQGDQR